MNPENSPALAILTEKAALAHLPDNLVPDQMRCLEAIRFCVEFVDISYARLLGSLRELTTFSNDPSRAVRTAALHDAWSVIDYTQRLRTLVPRLRKYKARAPSKQIFLRDTAHLEELRNAAQHVATDLSAIVAGQYCVFGVLTWLTVRNREMEEYTMNTLRMGQLAHTQRVNPVLQLPEDHTHMTEDVDYVTLWVGDLSANISDAYRSVAAIARKLEAMAAKQFEGLPSTLNDVVANMLVQQEWIPEGSTSAI